MLPELERFIASLPIAAPSRPRLLFRHGGSGPSDTTQVFVWGAQLAPIALVKVAIGEVGRAMLRLERRRLEVFSAALSARSVATVPSVVGHDEQGELSFLAQSFFTGRRLKDLSARAAGKTVDRVVDWLIEMTLAVGPRGVSSGAQEVYVNLDKLIDIYRATFAGSAELRLLDELPSRLLSAMGEPLPLVAAHGDFSDANVLVRADGEIAVVDWGEPFAEWTLPGADLFHFLYSVAATPRGLGRRDAFEASFSEAFFAETERSRTNRAAWCRYRDALGLAKESVYPLFAAAWILLAVRKLRYLEEQACAGRAAVDMFAQPQCDFPLVFFADNRCLNLAMTAEMGRMFFLQEA